MSEYGAGDRWAFLRGLQGDAALRALARHFLDNEYPKQQEKPMALTVYRRHYCGAKHRTYRTLAQCIWKRAEGIEGEGPYAVLARCRKPTVSLHETVDAAEEAKQQIDETGCGGGCRGQRGEVYG